MRLAPWLAIVGLTFALVGVPLFAQPDKPAPAKPAEPTRFSVVELPLKRVVLFNAGVGFFHREGEVDGAAKVTLKAPVEDVNDLIKTLIATDAGGGKPGVITFDNRAPAEITLKAFALDLTENPSIGQLLLQVRGEKIEITDQAGTTLTGTIVSVQKPTPQVVPGVDGTTSVVVQPKAEEVEQVTLLTDDGVQTVAIAKAKKVKFANPDLQAEFKQALLALAAARGGATKGIAVTFAGNGKRKVGLGYVTESPLWKPTYRINLAEKGATVQGWATVENTTEEDWKDVTVRLVSGRPMTFQMDLYDPLFVPRPMVEPQLYASLRPPMYQASSSGIGMQGQLGVGGGFGGGGFGGGLHGFQGVAQGGFGGQAVNTGHGQIGQLQSGYGFGMNHGLTRPSVRSLMSNRLDYNEFAGRKEKPTAGEIIRDSNLKDKIDNADDLGEAFEYAVADPVTLPRLKTALLPIINEAADATRVSIYNPHVLGKHPLLGVKLTNTSKLFLAQGPVAVYDGDTYAGDARLADVKPGEARLFSYAIDLTTHAKHEAGESKFTLASVRVEAGKLLLREIQQDTTTYQFTNDADRERTVLVTRPIRPEWKLVAPANPTDRTADLYRFEVKVPAKGSAKLDVAEETIRTEALDLATMPDGTVEYHRTRGATPPAVKAALARVQADRAKVTAVQRSLADQQATLKEVAEEQARIRANIERVPRESEAFKRYLKKFDDQETQIETAQARVKELQTDLEKQSKESKEMLRTLKAE